ncbi:MAG: hypothetical protein WKG01_05475 [Kofleriaceae bacterium]
MTLAFEQHPERSQTNERVEPGRPAPASRQLDPDALAPHPNGIFAGLKTPEETRATRPGAPLHFGSDEHQEYGNEGAKRAGYTGAYSPGSGQYPFELTQGDISLLAGDQFDAREPAAVKADPRQKKEKKAGVFDSFWTLARTPSRSPGRQPGTQDEIVYALLKDVPGDARFQPGGVWVHLVPIFKQPGNKVKVAVDNRYLWSASVNFEHFSHPGGHNGPKESADRGSAGGSYNALHETALKRAYDAQQAGQAVNDAMAHDAAAQHFLQDGFSSGHVRTPRREISEYWDTKYPLLNDQFKKSIAQEMAVYINANETNVATVLGSVKAIYEDILAQVDEKAGALPPLTMDPLVGLVAHDVDNVQGVWVKNEWSSWQSFGDGHGAVRTPKGQAAPPANETDTKQRVEEAVTLSVQDINAAYSAPAGLTEAALFTHVRSKTPSPAKVKDSYGAEQAMPQVDSSKEASKQNWKAGSLVDLWKLPVRTDGKGGTYGDIIEHSFQDPGGDFHKALNDFHDQIDVKQDIIKKGRHVGTVHPQRAFDSGFRDPLIDKPLARLQKIINFNPSGGQNYTRDDSSTMSDLNRLDKLGAEKASDASGKTEKPNNSNSAIRWLNAAQRAEYVKNLAGGYLGDDETRRIYELFVSASSGAERREVFKRVEGHAWSGDLTRKDSTLWMVFLDGKNRTPFIKIMNLQ